MIDLGSYIWGRYGTLWRVVGLPIYAGDVLLSPKRLARWWPINWLVVPPVYLYAVVYCFLKGEQP